MTDVSINCHKLISLWEENINLILSFLAILSINAYLDRHKLEDLRDIAEEKGLSESQEEEAKHLVESNPDLIRNSEEEEAARALFQGKGKGNDYCAQCPWMRFWWAKIAAASWKYLRLACVIKVIIIDI